MKRLLLVATLATLCSSCAFMNRRNLPAMNFCREHLIPENKTARLALAPVTVPVCAAAGMLDAAVVHPVSVVGDAWLDTEALLWRSSGRGYVTECALFPVRASLTPVVWLIQFSSRSVFDRLPYPPSPARLKTRLLSKNRQRRMWTILALARWSYEGEDIAPATDAMLEACRVYAADAEFCAEVIRRLPRPLTDSAAKYLEGLARTGKGYLCQVSIWRLFVECLSPPKSAGQGVVMKNINRMAKLYEDLGKAGHHEAEVYIADLAARKANVRSAWALALYITRSLARRGWPDYSEAVAFRIQMQLFRNTNVARIDAVEYEWRALRLKWGWLAAVREAIQRQEAGKGSLKTALTRKQNEIAAKLREANSGQAAELYYLAEVLVHVKTLLDAEEMAERLLKGPRADLELFMGSPLELLKKKGKP